jgi:hypothetical protein
VKFTALRLLLYAKGLRLSIEFPARPTTFDERRIVVASWHERRDSAAGGQRARQQSENQKSLCNSSLKKFFPRFPDLCENWRDLFWPIFNVCFCKFTEQTKGPHAPSD